MNIDKQVSETMGLDVKEEDGHIYYWDRVRWDEYSPSTNIAQAIELLEEFQIWTLARDGETYSCEIELLEEFIADNEFILPWQGSPWLPTPSEAICHAFLKTKGFRFETPRCGCTVIKGSRCPVHGQP